MTKEANGGTELIVLGRDEQGKPQAARFPAGHHGLVAKAAKAMNLAVCKADGEVLSELAKKLPPGRLYSTGRGFVPSVGRSLYGTREICTSGTVRDEGGNILIYSANDRRIEETSASFEARSAPRSYPTPIN
jgi:hypothetical protein